jgi:uncharacterized integral membrane protein (TIGR00697 family)
MKKSEKLYLFITVFFVTNLVLANVLAPKIVCAPFFPSIPMSFTTLTYPLTFLVTDVVAEIWGLRRANTIVYLGFAMNVFTLVLIQAAMHTTPHPGWVAPNNPYGYQAVSEYQNAFGSVFSASFWLILGSMCAYLSSQLADIRIFHALRKLTKGKHLWLRNNLSTMTSQLIDTTVMCTIFLYIGLGLDKEVCLLMIVTDYTFRFIFALLDTPLCYLIVHSLKKVIAEETTVSPIPST